MVAKLELTYETGSFVCGSFGPVAIAIWESQANLSEVMRSAELLDTVAEKHDRISLFALIGEKGRGPDSEGRKVLTQAVMRHRERIVRVAHVMESNVFLRAGVRGFLSSMTLVVRPKFKPQVFSTLAEGAVFLGEAHPEVSHTSLAQAVRDLRSNIRELPGAAV